jgi:3-ketosteroid 9alpha-monooxygenase subunit B
VAVDHSPVLREHGYHPLVVKRVVPETSDASSFVLEMPDELAATFRYRPGQFCTFRVRIGGEEHLRSYSMSSAPETDPDLTVTVKRVAGGLVSNWFCDSVSAGTVLDVTKPAGVFCAVETETARSRPVLGFCGGSGITPVMSIAKHVLASTSRSVRLLYANRDASSVIFEGALEELRGGHEDRVEVRHHLDADGGFLSAADVSDFVGSSLDADCYVCGPGPFMDLVESTLLGLGVEPEHIFIERFLVEQQEKEAALVAPVPVPGGTTEAPVADGEEGGGSADEPGGGGGTKEVTVVLGGKTVVVAYQSGDSLLETARRGGLRPPFSCQAGNCATCMAFLKEGTVTMRFNNALTPEEVEEGWILTCQGLPTSEAVTVEYEAM